VAAGRLCSCLRALLAVAAPLPPSLLRLAVDTLAGA
jgi:hypothetical protein